MRPLALILGAAAALVCVLWLQQPERSVAPLEARIRRAEPAPRTPQGILEAVQAPVTRAAEPSPPPPRADPAAALRELGAACAGPQWVDGARASAAELDPQSIEALARSAASEATPAFERCAAAEVLRHVPGAALPAPALAFLRRSFEARETEPMLALAAVRALGAFGGADDRARLLDAAVQSNGLALCGLSCARGDEVAREFATLASETRDARRAEIALAALAAIASSDEGGLTPRARAECAAALDAGFADAREPRRLCALAALDPRLAAR